MKVQETALVPGTLWSTIQHRTQVALANHAVQPIATRQLTLAEGGVDFLVRKISSFAQKHDDQIALESKPKASSNNPFLPYEPDLYVGEVAPYHRCLLNKYNVIENHVLVVTRDFEHQENLLSEQDFAAWFSCLREFNSLGFYNSGKVAGASQTHKHMQLIPLPLSKQGVEFPFVSVLRTAKPQSLHPGQDDQVLQCELPFQHAVIALDTRRLQDAASAASYLCKCYHRLLSTVGIEGVPVDGDIRQSAPYNFLISKQWMWLVPRSREYYQGSSVNSLGFAGSLFVRDSAQLELVRQAGPMAILRFVARGS